VDAVGKDAEAVERALREDLKVPLSAEILRDSELAKSKKRFPFVQHIACDSCLTSEGSPSGQLNRAYEELALGISPIFHRVVRELSAIESKFFAIADTIESHGVTPDTLETETREQIRHLCHERDRIYAQALQRSVNSLPTIRPVNLGSRKVVHLILSGVALSLRCFSGGLGSNPQKT
jgi:hypothetical protein